MAMNTGKVVVGGVAAGVVNNALGFALFGLMLAPRFNAEMDAVMPGMSAKMNTTNAMVITIVFGFILGWLQTWLYAAMRPRFGPGPKTATYGALVVWACGFLFHIELWMMGTVSTATYMMATVAALVQCVGTSQAGAFVYKEEGA